MMSLCSGNHSHALAENVRGHEPAPGLTVEKSHQCLMISATAKQFLSISFCRRGFSCWTVTKSRHRHLPGSCLYCRCFTAPHLPHSVLSQHSAPAPRGGGRRSFKEATFPTPIIYLIFSCKWFYCSCSFHGMTTKGRSDNSWLNSWWQFWVPCLSCWVLTCAIS